MRRVANTSQWAYDSIGKQLGEMQSIVFRVIGRHQPLNNEQIAYVLGWPINRVTGRQIEKVALLSFVAVKILMTRI